MARNKKTYSDDDGRTIADMSGVSRPNLWSFRSPFTSSDDTEPSQEKKPDRPWDTSGQLSRRERRMFIIGALGAALLLCVILGVCFAVAILIIGRSLF